ncbi:MAG: HSP20 family molecular chaperone IbpA [Candidatus Azotimanducaceae bacterium]|jgi:HSP20 family molecular chaperone IbpA
MSHLIYAPFGALNQLHREFGRAFDDRPTSDAEVAKDEAGTWAPQVDIKEDEQGFSVLMDLPGVDPKQVAVTIDRDILTIRGNRTLDDNVGTNEDTHKKQSRNKSAYKRRERVSGACHRHVSVYPMLKTISQQWECVDPCQMPPSTLSFQGKSGGACIPSAPSD